MRLGPHRKMLILGSDRGSSGWLGFNFLFTPKVNCRGHAIPDMMHRRNDGIHTAFQKSKCGSVEAEGVILFNFFKGAFLRGSFIQRWKANTSKNPMFRFCYQWIVAFGEKGVYPASYGSEDHMEEVWQSLPISTLWKSCGAGLKLSRWMAWNVKERGSQIFFGEYMLAFLVLGLFEGFYQSLADLPSAASEIEAIILNGDGRLQREAFDEEMHEMELEGLDGDDGGAGAVPAARAPVREGGKDGAELFCPGKNATRSCACKSQRGR